MNIPKCPVCDGERELNAFGGYSCFFCGTSTVPIKNPAAVALGKLGGRPKGSKGKPIGTERAKAMAYARWHPNNDEHQEDYKLAAQARRDADEMAKRGQTTSTAVNTETKG